MSWIQRGNYHRYVTEDGREVEINVLYIYYNTSDAVYDVWHRNEKVDRFTYLENAQNDAENRYHQSCGQAANAPMATNLLLLLGDA